MVLFADGAYEQRKVYHVLESEAADPVIPSRKNAQLWQHGNSSKPKLPRDEAIREIRHTSPNAWKVKADTHIRALGETVMYRLKSAFGGKLKNRKIHNQKTEAALRCRVRNKSTQLGRRKFQWD